MALVSVAATLPILAGMWVGGFIRKFVSPDLFRKIILGVIVVSGIHLLATGVHL